MADDKNVVNFPVIVIPADQSQVPQDQGRVAPKNIFSSGQIPGLTAIRFGGNDGVTLAGNQGMWAGAVLFSDAPWSVDLDGNMKASQATISGTVTSGSPTGAHTVVDGTNGQIRIYDSTNTLVGIIYAGVGNAFFSSSLNPLSGTFNLNASQTSVTGPDTGTVFLEAFNNGLLQSCDITITSTTATVHGNFTVTGTKAFDIEHPKKEGMRLRYIAVESPEVLVMSRGICDTEEEIEYPQHFLDITEPDSIQCQIGKLRGSTKISWLATGVRIGYADFEPEYIAKADEEAS